MDCKVTSPCDTQHSLILHFILVSLISFLPASSPLRDRLCFHKRHDCCQCNVLHAFFVGDVRFPDLTESLLLVCDTFDIVLCFYYYTCLSDHKNIISHGGPTEWILTFLPPFIHLHDGKTSKHYSHLVTEDAAIFRYKTYCT